MAKSLSNLSNLLAQSVETQKSFIFVCLQNPVFSIIPCDIDFSNKSIQKI